MKFRSCAGIYLRASPTGPWADIDEGSYWWGLSCSAHGEFEWRVLWCRPPTGAEGCGDVHCLPVTGGGPIPAETVRWTWDGDVKRPTLVESIACAPPRTWHGHLIAGRFAACE